MGKVNALYGCFLKFEIPANRICMVLDEVKEMYGLAEADENSGEAPAYTVEEFARVEEVLRYQEGKYCYMFP